MLFRKQPQLNRGISRVTNLKRSLFVYCFIAFIGICTLLYSLNWASGTSQYLKQTNRLLTTTKKLQQGSPQYLELNQDAGVTQNQQTPGATEQVKNLDIVTHTQHPKVALLFLTRGQIVTEPIWTQFFKLAGEFQLVADPPTQHVGFERRDLEQYLEQQLYPETTVDWEEFNSTCWNHPNTTTLIKYSDPAKSRQFIKPAEALKTIEYKEIPDVIDSQNLFSVYVHTKPDFEGYPSSSIFRGKIVDGLVETRFGEHSLVEAEKVLLAAALKDPQNRVFVLLSDSCIPIYHPTVVYAQLMSEKVSRVDGCSLGKEAHRWSDLMRTDFFSYEQYRKSSQWWALSRPHATLVLADRHIEPIMKTYCSTKLWCEDTSVAHICVSDESYVPSVLATYGLDNETNCQARLTAADWKGMGWHPREFTASSVTAKLMQKLRTDKCMKQQSKSLVSYLFDLRSSGGAQSKVDWNTFKPMDNDCPLFARKFPTNSTVNALLKIYKNCNGLQLNNICVFGLYPQFLLG